MENEEETFKRLQQELEAIEVQKAKNKKLAEQSYQSFVNSQKPKIVMHLFYQSVRWRLILLTYALMWAFGAVLGMVQKDITVIDGMLGATYVTTFFLGLTLIKYSFIVLRAWAKKIIEKDD